ncbi:MAG: ribonuclease P protein component [Giesbergeria sp.]|nr:ribonuclease P protein component [Giesbergeria sp.]MBP6321900.1 ribonuclease P protein component [Giesbergeria sp.]MBP8029069.1 ribonuclease P protein component [Giesbergeria sp.]MBP8840346.1 ribonuclease P protein component [Giesbergeria sp.]
MQRLKTRAQFQAAMAGGTVARTAHFALHRLVLETKPAAHSSLADAKIAKPLFGAPDVWLGAMAPKRWARRAVTRNAIKRQIYNVAATLEPQLLTAAHVVRLRAMFDRKLFVSASSDALKAAVRNELLQLFARAAASGKQP